MGMFDRYSKNPKEIPCNIHEYLTMPEINCIVVGGTCYTTSRLAFPYDRELMKVSVSYYQAERLFVTKSNGIEVYPVDGQSFIVKCNLSEEETRMFGDTNLDTFSQVRVEYGDRVLFGPKTRITVIEPIEEVNHE